MKALLSRRPGPPETLQVENVPDPQPGQGELLIAVKACSVNYPDLLIIQDLYQFKPARPFSPDYARHASARIHARAAGLAFRAGGPQS